MKWNVGDLAIVVRRGGTHGKGCAHVVGSICELIKPSEAFNFDWVISVEGEWYDVIEYCLKPLPKHGSWDEIEKTTGYRPRVLERVEK